MVLIAGAIGILILSIRFNLSGKATSLTGIAKTPNYFSKAEGYFKQAMFKQWYRLDDEIDSKIKLRGKLINNALNCLIAAGSLYVISISLIAFKTYASYLSIF